MGIAHELSWETQVTSGLTGLSCSELIAMLNGGRYALIAGGRRLAAELDRAGYTYTPAEGSYAGSLEPMFMVHDPDERDMVALATKYQQDSVVIGEGGEQKMVFTHGPHKGRMKAGRGWQLATGREGSFTTITTTDGLPVRFTLSF